MPLTLAEIDTQIADLEGQISTAQQGGGEAGPDYSAFFKSPGYQFRLDEGVRAIDRSASARGQLMSGGIQRELTRYGQGLASSEFNSYANRLSDLAGIGSSVATAGGQLGATAAGQVGASAANIGQSIMAAGSARASGIIGSNNALNQGIQGALGSFNSGGLGSFNSGGGSTAAFSQGVRQGTANSLFGAGWNASPSTAANIAWF